MVEAIIVVESLVGLWLARWLWTAGVPERYVRPRVPSVLDGHGTVPSDYRGLA